MEQGRVFSHRVLYIHHRRQFLILHLDQGQSFLGDVRAGSSHRSHRMPSVQNLIASQEIVTGKLETLVVPTHLTWAQGGNGKIFGSDDGTNPRMGLSLAGIN